MAARLPSVNRVTAETALGGSADRPSLPFGSRLPNTVP
jgi:hypothetical protein